jgi:hypothetical protein
MFRSDSKSDERNPRVIPKSGHRFSEKITHEQKAGAGMMPRLKVIPRYRPRSAGLISNPSVAENVAPHSAERSPVGLSAVLTPPGSAPRSPVIT